MKQLGYMYKQVIEKPDWIKSQSVRDIYSLSGCISKNFAEYINFWKHNGYWLYDSPEIIESLCKSEGIDLNGQTLFYYEAYELEYSEYYKEWQAYQAEPTFVTNVSVPEHKTLQGFDVTTFSVHTSPECSPLACNSLAECIKTNEHCLFSTFEEAKNAVETGFFINSEPGPYRIIAVYTVEIENAA